MPQRMEGYMDNDNKVKDIVKKSKNIFLKDALTIMGEEPKVYSLEEEFARAKKNKSLALYWIVAGFIIIVILNAVIITAIVQNKSRQMNFQISGFDDIRLSEIFSTVKKNENRLNNLGNEILELKKNIEKEIIKIKNSYALKRAEIAKKKLPASKEKPLLNELNSKEEQSISLIKESYRKQIEARERESAQLQTEVRKYDKQLETVTKKAEEIVNNYQKLNDLKMQEQKDNLILKYNPYFDSERLIKIITGPIDTNQNKTLDMNLFFPDLSREDIMNETYFNELRKNIENHSLLITRLREIPYENSVGLALVHIEHLFKVIVNTYEKFWNKLFQLNQKMNDIIKNKNSSIQQYQYAFDYLAMKQSENGYIIDPREPENIMVFINKIHAVKPGDYGIVFRNDDEYIGKIVFITKNNEIKAKIVELHENNQIMPFDKILIQIEKE